MNLRKTAQACVGAMAALLVCATLHAQTQVPFAEQFTGINTDKSWYFYDGACLTAGTNRATSNPGRIPGCTSILSSYYQKQAQSDPALVGGDNGYLGGSRPPATSGLQQPDDAGTGALRFTNGYPYGQFETGAIISADMFSSRSGLQITFKTVTYRGTTVDYDGKGGAGDGADGISFFLMNGATDLSRYPGVGANGGSLGYTCTNSFANFDTAMRSANAVRGFDGLVGGYLGVGVDEFGNYLNGTVNTLGLPTTAAPADDTATGGGYQPNMIGLRGAGSVSWAALNTAYGNNPNNAGRPYYPTRLNTQCPTGTGTFDSTRRICALCSVGAYDPTRGTCSSNGVLTKNPPYSALAVRNTCATGTLYNYSNPDAPTPAGATSLSNPVNTAGILDYAAIGGTAISSLGPGYLIANESAVTRAQATPITYHLSITTDNLLSLAFSYNGGSFQPVITDQDLTASIGPVPANLRFGFAGATGGSTNIHEILCFQATPATLSSSGAGVSTLQNPVVNTDTTQLFLAYYVPDTSTGRVTAQSVSFDPASNVVSVSSVPNWDASCVLTGVNGATGACSTGVTNLEAQTPAKRTMLTWNGARGVAFEWNNLAPAQAAALALGGSTAVGQSRLAFLRGERTNELNSQGAGLFRTRAGVLGDVVDSSPTWVGPPQTYSSTVTWGDQLYPGATAPERSGQTYASFQAQQQSRLNVVYVGSNDGFLHGFRAGSLDKSGSLINNSATPNDGQEVLAYMPGSVLQSSAWSSAASPTQSVVQNIHGVLPADPPSMPGTSVRASLDFSSPKYGHNYFVDATPASGDVFWGGTWHTLLVGGLGAGGAALYALDVTNPGAFSEQSSAPEKVVIGEWTAANLTCVNVSGCGTHLGDTYGIPSFRRFHNGSWGVIFGNGHNSPGGGAGLFIMLINPASGARTFYYLATATSAASNGISTASSLDLDGDHIVDYLYAGDLLGNIWRFDVTSQDPLRWAVSTSSPLFNAGQPITTAIAIGTRKTVAADATYAGLSFTNAPQRVILNFGTGRQIPQTATDATLYATGTHNLYGIWDWDMSAWNRQSAAHQAVTLVAPQSITSSNLLQQTISTNNSVNPATRTVSTLPVCWQGGTNCGSGRQNQFGWYVTLPGSSGASTLVNGQTAAIGEQILFDPQITTDGELVVNTYIPALDTPLVCNPAPATGFTMAIEPDTGEQSSTAYFSVNGVAVSGVQNNGVGVPLEVTTGWAAGHDAEYLITQTSSGHAATPTLINRHTIVSGQRLSWIQRR